jgi:hypothetical protein
MPQVVKKGGANSYPAPVVIKLALQHDLQDTHQSTRHMEYADAVRKPSVGGTWINQIREPQLLYPAQPLKFGRIEKPPYQSLEVIRFAECDKSMNRIAYPAKLRHCILRHR